MVADQGIGKVAVPLAPGQMPHRDHVRGALYLKHFHGRPAREQRDDRLRVQRVGQVALGTLRLGQLLGNVGHAVVGDRVPLPIRSGARLGTVGHDQAGLHQPGQGRVDLAVGQLVTYVYTHRIY